MLIEILTFSFKKLCLKVSSAKWHPFCLGLNVLTGLFLADPYYGDQFTDLCGQGRPHCGARQRRYMRIWDILRAPLMQRSFHSILARTFEKKNGQEPTLREGQR